MSGAPNPAVVVPLRDVAGTIAEPPVSPDCDLSGFRDMKLDLVQLGQSKTWAILCKREPELGYYHMNLWIAGWQRKPAGSLPNDDDELCEAAKCDPARWPAVRAALLKDWKLCEADGRRYHLFLCEKVKQAWAKRMEFRDRARNAANKRHAAERKRREEAEAARAGAVPPRPAGGPGGCAAAEERTPREVLETEGVAMLARMTDRTWDSCERLMGQLCRDSGDHDESVLRIVRAAAAARDNGRGKADPVSWIRKAVRDDAAERKKAAATSAGAGPQARGRGRQAPAAETQATRQIEHFAAMGAEDLPPEMDDRPFTIEHEGRA